MRLTTQRSAGSTRALTWTSAPDADSTTFSSFLAHLIDEAEQSVERQGLQDAVPSQPPDRQLRPRGRIRLYSYD